MAQSGAFLHIVCDLKRHNSNTTRTTKRENFLYDKKYAYYVVFKFL